MNILTFDIEEWFHILDNDSTKTEKEWSNYEYRLEANMDRIFELLDRKNQKATLDALGLHKMNQVVEHEATPSILGMVNTVKHLISVEEVK